MEPRAKLPEETLIADALSGGSDSFAELVRRYQPALARVARSRLGRDDWAEDVVQETFMAAFKSLAGYDARYSFRTWLWTILLNQCHRHYQRRARSLPLQPWTAVGDVTVDASADEHGDSPLAALLAQERTAHLEALLGQLTPVQADALRLRFFGGLKFGEIAEAMQCSLNAAKSRVRIGLLRMAELLRTAETQVRQRDSR